MFARRIAGILYGILRKGRCTMKKFAPILLAALLLCGCAQGSAPSQSPAASGSPEPAGFSDGEIKEFSQTFVDYLNAGQFDEAYAMFSPAMQEALPLASLKAAWQQLTTAYGAYQSFDPDAAQIGAVEANQVLVGPIEFDRAMNLTLSFNADGLIDGFFVTEIKASASAAEEKPPEDVVQTEVEFPSQPDMPLHGTLTFPSGGAASAAVVFVHGSGPNDRNESVGSNALFRDLAWGLAKEGIASLRYDKVTYTYSGIATATFTVDQETALDAVAAVQWLKAQEGIDPDRVFVLGHSQGAMLASYIQSMGAGAAGLIVAAGSPRQLWEISADQNRIAVEEILGEGRKDEAAQAEAAIRTELDKAAHLADLSDDEALKTENAVFGMPAWYLRHWGNIDAAALHLANPVPTLFLHGDKDRQVYTQADFDEWKKRLAAHPDAEYKLYDDLNHMFGAYQGEPVPIMQIVAVEYAQRTPAPQQVIDDIAAWIAGH